MYGPITGPDYGSFPGLRESLFKLFKYQNFEKKIYKIKLKCGNIYIYIPKEILEILLKFKFS